MMLTLIKCGLEGQAEKKDRNKRPRVRYLPGDIQTAISSFKQSNIMTKIFGESFKKKYLDLKQNAADRSPQSLGIKVKNGEVLYHHEVYNQMIWNDF